jgi:hypothetical protein
MECENRDMYNHRHDALMRRQPVKQVLCSWIRSHHQIASQKLGWIEEGGTGGCQGDAPTMTALHSMDSVLEEILMIIGNPPIISP